ncbi:MAG: hypothetical protein SFU86_00695 [Pirellulaceae bacterium]|nr:hypothetical protein [Pirellulaceae bacterium]
MSMFLNRMWRETDGTLSFEWTMLTSLLTIGAVSGVSAVRDAVTDEMGDLAQAMVSLDQSYYIEPPLVIRVHDGWGYGYGFGGGVTGVGPGVGAGAGQVGFGYGGWGGYGGSAASSSMFIDASSYDDCQRGNMKVIEFPRKSDNPNGNNPAPAPAELEPAI